MQNNTPIFIRLDEDTKRERLSRTVQEHVPDLTDDVSGTVASGLLHIFDADILISGEDAFVDIGVEMLMSDDQPDAAEALEISKLRVIVQTATPPAQELQELQKVIDQSDESALDLKRIAAFTKKKAKEASAAAEKLAEEELSTQLQNIFEKKPSYKSETDSARKKKLESYLRREFSVLLRRLEGEILKCYESRIPKWDDLVMQKSSRLEEGRYVHRFPIDDEIDLPPHHVPQSEPDQRVELVAPTEVYMKRPIDPPSDDVMLWAVIRNRTQAISFNSYMKFIESRDWTLESNGRPLFQGVDAFKRLREMTETFLLAKAGVLPFDYATGSDNLIEQAITSRDENKMFVVGADRVSKAHQDVASTPYSEVAFLGNQQKKRKRRGDTAETEKSINDSLKRLSYGSPELIRSVKVEFLETLRRDGNLNPYLNAVLRQFQLCNSEESCNLDALQGPDFHKARSPLFMELIWSYWQEQGLLTQTMKSVALRFQNKARSKHDRLAHLEIDPLRPVNNLIWGYIQQESKMLTVTRRNYEYQHQYGLSLSGHAVGGGRAADVREQFLEAFHTLLHLVSEFFRQDDDRMVTSDAFPVLNALKEVHLYLSKGAHNQFGDLAWTARTEMLMEQWLLSHDALREFIAGRIMVAYPERWQRQVDGMMSVQGWGDISCIHFNNLAAFGEQILLSIRYIPWVNIHDQGRAKLWAQFWRQEIQGYIHAYRAATGVDLSGNYSVPMVNVAQPDPLIRRRRIRKPALGRY